jgi:predicted nucleic acid-binding protein
MRVLLDTNILGRYSEPDHQSHRIVVRALNHLAQEGHDFCLVPQILYEFWAVATRPAEKNGLGLSPEATGLWVDTFLRLFSILRDERGILEQWLSLVRDCGCQGKAAHDARIVAAMKRHGITHILTLDTDFARFKDVVALEPWAVVG